MLWLKVWLVTGTRCICHNWQLENPVGHMPVSVGLQVQWQCHLLCWAANHQVTDNTVVSGIQSHLSVPSHQIAGDMLLLSKNVKAAAVSCGAVRRVCQLNHGYRGSGVGQSSQKQHAGSCPTNPAAVSGSVGRLYSTSRWVVACAAESKLTGRREVRHLIERSRHSSVHDKRAEQQLGLVQTHRNAGSCMYMLCRLHC